MKPANNKIWSLSFIFVVIANALVFMIFEMLLPTLPLFVTALGEGAGQVGLVTGIFTLSAIVTRPFAGLLATKFDKKMLLIIGILLNALSIGAYYLADGIPELLIIRLIHGAGFGLITTYFATLAAEIVPKERRGEGIGYFGVGETVAISVGPMIGILTLELYDFQRLFLGGMAVLILGVIMAVFIKRTPEGKKMDKEINVKIKFFEKRVFFPGLLVLLVGIAAGGIMSFFSLYALEREFTQVGLFFFLVAVASFVVRIVSGKLFDKYGPTIIIIPGSLFSIVGLLLLYVAASDVMLLTAAVFYGFGFGAILPAIQTWCLNLVGEHEHEDAMATFFNFFDLGIGGGSLILGLAVAASDSYQVIYIIATLIYVLLLIIYMVHWIVKRKSVKYGGNNVQTINQTSSNQSVPQIRV